MATKKNNTDPNQAWHNAAQKPKYDLQITYTNNRAFGLIFGVKFDEFW